MTEERLIQIVQDPSKFKWAGIPLHKRYSSYSHDDKALLKKIHEIDELLDIKIYYPTNRWHLVRYPEGRLSHLIVRVWNIKDNPQLGIRGYVGDWMIEALKMADTWGYAADRIDEVDANNAAHDAEHDRKTQDVTTEMAREIYKPLQALVANGPDADYKEFW